MTVNANFRNGPWSDDAVRARAVSLWADGVSATQVASILCREFRHVSVSRNAVIGLVHRQKLQRGAASAPSLRVAVVKPKTVKNPDGSAQHLFAKAQTRARIIMGGNGSVTNSVAADKPLPPPRADRLAPQVARLLDLQPHQCRWPYGDHDFAFCGRRAPESQPYCESHATLARSAFQPSKKDLPKTLRRYG